MSEHHERPFYDVDILRAKEQEYIKKILKKYKNDPVNEELKKKIWDELQMEKHLGNLKIPFKVSLRRDAAGKYPEYVEVILDTKV
jgi:hypothetical protein